jgi:hypothetical protein
MSYDKELRSILKKIKNDFIPDVKSILRLTTLISTCKTAAYELYSYLMSNHWKYFRKWLLNAEKNPSNGAYSDSRKAII